jgi:hypothetical protein
MTIRARLRRSWRFIALQFWVLIGLAVLAGLAGDAVSREWWRQVVPFLKARWPWVLIGAAAAAAALRLTWWLWWRLPKWQVDHLGFPTVNDRAEAEDNFRKTAGQLLGGAAVLIGAVAARICSSRSSSRQPTTCSLATRSPRALSFWATTATAISMSAAG